MEKKKKKESKKSKKKQDAANKPMHFTANNEPRALDVLGDLDPNIFNECKEKMRPVKKSLKALDRGHHGMNSEEQASNKRECLLRIGNRIDECLAEHNDPGKIKEWRSNLWYFVSKFTEDNASKLFKMYKNEKARENGTKDGASSSKSDKKDKHHHHHHHSNNHSNHTGEVKERKKEKKKKDHQNNSKTKSGKSTEKLPPQEHSANDDACESYGKRRLEREEGEIDDSKDYKRLAGESR